MLRYSWLIVFDGTLSAVNRILSAFSVLGAVTPGAGNLF